MLNNYILGINSMKKIILPCLLLIIIGAYTEVLLSEIVKDIPCKLNEPDKIKSLIFYAACVGLIYCFSSEMVGWLISGPIQEAYKKSMRDSLEAYISTDYATFKQMGVGKILKIMERRSTSTGELFCVVVIQMLPIPISFLFVTVSLLRHIYYLVYVVILFYLILYSYFTIVITNHRVKLRKVANEEINEANNISNEILCNYEVLKSFNNEGYEINRLEMHLKRMLKPIIRLWKNLYLLNWMQKIILTFMDISVYVLFYINRGDSNITNKASLIQYVYISNMIRKKLSNLGSIYGSLMCMRANLISCALPEKEKNEGKDLKFNEEIEAKDLIIKNNKKIFLRNMNFTIRKGDKVALIGSNGSGKTTFIRSLLGFYEYEGSLQIDNQELKEISKRSLRNNIAFVPQDSCLMNETIKENICYGEKKTDEEIYEISSKFKVNDSFERLEKGYLTKIGERGKNLSGGEKQKVALIRGAIRNKKIFILDEPTASIDPLAEKEIFASLLQESSTTILVIVHNLDLLRNFNKVLHFDDNSATLYDSYEEFNNKHVDQIDFYKQMMISSDRLEESEEDY